MNCNLRGKVIIVAGAGLLGEQFVRAIAENNGAAIILDINGTKGKKLASELTAQGKSVEYAECDITDKISLRAVLNKVVEKHGKIEALINSAYPKNKNYGKKFEEVEYRDFCENINLHLGGYFLLMQQVAEYMKKQRYGNIINVASVYGVIAPKFEIYKDTKMVNPVEYAVIKSSVIHMTKYLAKYLKGYNIRINCLSPGGIYDNQPEEFVARYNELCQSKGMLDKKDLNGAILFLLSDNSKYINGQNIVLDDGFSL